MTTVDLYACVLTPDINPPSRHSTGMPPTLSDEGSERMAWPRVLLIEFRDDGIFLVRYSIDGEFAGDTWHQALDDALHQARVEYGDQVGEWRAFPKEVEEKLTFALQSCLT